MSSGAVKIHKKSIPMGLMGVGAIKQESKENIVIKEVIVEEISDAQEQLDYVKTPFFSLKKIAIEKGYKGEMKKQPILEYLQSKSLNNER